MENENLTKCPDCNSTISRRALWCVRCGRELLFRPARWFYTAVFLASISILLGPSLQIDGREFHLMVFVPAMLLSLLLLLESIRTPNKLP